MKPFHITRARAIIGLLLLTILAGCARPAARQQAGTPGGAAPTTRPRMPGPLPTATVPAIATSAGAYANPDLGIAFSYPTGWRSAEAPSDQFLLQLEAPQRALIIQVAQTTATLTDTIGELRDSLIGEGFSLLKDGPLSLPNLNQAWSGEFALDQTDYTLNAQFVLVAHGSHLFNFTFIGLSQIFDSQRGAINNLLSSIDLSTPVLYGISRDQALVTLGGESTNPRSYDPAHGGGDGMVFSGLVSFNDQFQVAPELAESWEVSGGGMVYTFHLRRDARFHNGRPVTSADVVYSWERAASPQTDSDLVLTYLGDIVGVKEMRAGEAEHISGLKAIDDHTLQVTIDAPKPYFLMKLTYSTGDILDEANVKSGPEWWRIPNGTGPYRLIRWEEFKAKIYQRNEDFYLYPPEIPFVIEQLYAGSGLRLYESGEIDMTGIGADSVERMRDLAEPMHAELRESISMCTSYIAFDVEQAPFDDLKVRQAFALAFDRQRYLNVVYNGFAMPARGLYPPALPGYSADLKIQDHDPERARQLLAESRYGGAAGLPPIRFTSAGWGSEIDAEVAALVQMWQATLGVTIEIENLEPNTFQDKIQDGDHGQLFSSGWCADYPDPENFADALFHSGAEQNTGNYSNPELDALLDQARVEQDVATRIGMYQQAEQMIVDDAPAIFIAHGMSFSLVKPYVKEGTYDGGTRGNVRYLKLER
jgi:oligopeptide transport system substrate-binding protein